LRGWAGDDATCKYATCQAWGLAGPGRGGRTDGCRPRSLGEDRTVLRGPLAEDAAVLGVKTWHSSAGEDVVGSAGDPPVLGEASMAANRRPVTPWRTRAVAPRCKGLWLR
jgi:hypothetical protein